MYSIQYIYFVNKKCFVARGVVDFFERLKLPFPGANACPPPASRSLKSTLKATPNN